MVLLKKYIKKATGSSLAEFAVTTALMATLAATAAPKLSRLSEGAKAEKTFSHIDKLIKQAGNFYQKTAEIEGRGRFPGQSRFYEPIGWPSSGPYINNDFSSAGLEIARQNSINHHEAILDDLGLRDLDGWRGTEHHNTENKWAWVFEQPNDGLHDDDYELEARIQETRSIHHGSVQAGQYGDDQWLSLFGDEILRSPYQFGDYAYTVVAGGGSGEDVYPPVIYIVDVENAVNFNSTLTP